MTDFVGVEYKVRRDQHAWIRELAIEVAKSTNTRPPDASAVMRKIIDHYKDQCETKKKRKS